MPEKIKTFRPHGMAVPRPRNTRIYYTKSWADTRKTVLQRDGWMCQACGKSLYGFDATVDHIEEMQKGGEMLPSLDRLQALCRSCNSRKGRKWQLS